MSWKKNAAPFLFLLFSVFLIWVFLTRIFSLHGNRIEKLIVGDGMFFAEVVSSGGKMQKGLGGRERLCHSCGMLFKFQQKGKHNFWMKGMNFPIDIIWINDGRAVHIEKNVPESFPGILSPRTDADQVLEINAGMSDRIGIREGDKVSF